MAKKTKIRDIGIDAKKPKGSCTSHMCPWHGHLKIRGRIFSAKVVSDKAPLTAVVKWNYLRYIRKYERYMRRRTRLSVHNPSCVGVKPGEWVKIMECRPLSKTKKFVIVERLSK